MRLDQLRAEPYQAFNLGHLLLRSDMDVEVDPILGDLALRQTWNEPRTGAELLCMESLSGGS
jgi:hypothetical protein